MRQALRLDLHSLLVGNSDFTITEKDISTGDDKVEPPGSNASNGIGEDVTVTRTESAASAPERRRRRLPMPGTFVNTTVPHRPERHRAIGRLRRDSAGHQLHRATQDHVACDGTLAIAGKLTDRLATAKGTEVQVESPRPRRGLDTVRHTAHTDDLYA